MSKITLDLSLTEEQVLKLLAGSVICREREVLQRELLQVLEKHKKHIKDMVDPDKMRVECVVTDAITPGSSKFTDFMVTYYKRRVAGIIIDELKELLQL